MKIKKKRKSGLTRKQLQKKIIYQEQRNRELQEQNTVLAESEKSLGWQLQLGNKKIASLENEIKSMKKSLWSRVKAGINCKSSI